MSIKNGYHYDDKNKRYYRNENEDRIPSYVCLCNAYEPSECVCDCTSWDDFEYHDDDMLY
jgi:hypothetical protein